MSKRSLPTDTPIHRPPKRAALQAMPPGVESPPFLPAGTRLLDYQIEKVLGHGGFGITYLARDTQLNKPMAIKEYMPPDLAFRSGAQVSVRTAAHQEAFNWGLRQFLKEAQTLALFSHANLVPVYRFFEANQTAYIVMAYAEGETFGSVLRREPAPSEEQLRAVLLPVMDGLEAVHRDGVLHRDIKPDNIIILAKDATPVLIDFGAARFNLGSATGTAMRCVSAGYAPLEQYGASASQGPWTDIYALGALAYRAVSGRKPPEAINRVHDDPLVPAAAAGSGRYSAAFLAAVDWALTMKAEDRPRNISEWRQALNGSQAGATQSTSLVTAQAAAGHTGVRTSQLLHVLARAAKPPRWAAWSVAAAAILSLGPALDSAAGPQAYASGPVQATHAQKTLQLASMLLEPVPPPESRARPKATHPAKPQAKLQAKPQAKPQEVADQAEPRRDDLRVVTLEEKLPIHRQR